MESKTPIHDESRFYLIRSPIPIEAERREQLERLTDEERLDRFFNIYEAYFRFGLERPDWIRDIELPEMTIEEKFAINHRIWDLAKKHGRWPLKKKFR